MATVDITSTVKSRYGSSSSWNGWVSHNQGNNDSDRFYLGSSGGTSYRFQLQVTIPSDIYIASTNKLVIGWKADSAITPKYMRGFLSTTAFGPNTDNWTASSILDVSNLWKDANKSSQFTSYVSSSIPFGYFVFDVNVSPGTTYYISVAGYSSNYGENTNSIGSNTGSGIWARGRNKTNYMTAYLDYNPSYAIDVNMYRADEDKWYYSGDGINKFHADVGGTRRATSANDFGYRAAAGTSYSVTPVAATGYHYNGTQGGSAISGTYPSNDFSVNLNFGKNYAYILYNQNEGVVTNSDYSINQYGWITLNGSYQFDPVYYGTSEDPYNASTFGLQRLGHTFSGWKVQGTNKILDQDTKYAATDYVKFDNSSQTVANASGFNCYTFAQWTPNNYTITLDPNGGSVSSSSVSLAYGNGAYTGLPTPTNGGKKFGGWFADIGNNGPIQLGYDYRYTDALNVGFDAYKEDWTDWAASEAFISCTNSGGWNLFAHSGLMGSDVWDSGAGAYKQMRQMFDLNTLSPGWHHFDMVFGNKKMYYYVDGVEVATSATFSGNIGLNRKSALWLGAEAGAGEAHDGACVFNGLLKNVRILNSTWADYPASVFPIPAQNITLYADWESSSYMFVKVNGEWRVGKTFIKLGNSWIG